MWRGYFPAMRYVIGALALCLTIVSPAFAAEQSGTPVQKGNQTHQQKLDEFFNELKRARNERAAARVASRIWQEWENSGSANIDLMMQWAKKAMDEQKFDIALDFLDQVVTMRPDFAEGWNRRATVHFMMKNFAKSMADIGQTLELEPRHFGALSGMALIFKARGSKQMAFNAYQRVLDIYPMMRDAQNEVATLSEELAGEAI
jgi:tetratricopeptide (TPR) repeat protein